MTGSFAVGTDIVSVPRVAGLLAGGGEAFRRRWFTEREIAYCEGKAHPGRHYAARMAAKEAVAKALEWEWDGPVIWRCIEIGHHARGAARAELSGPVLELARAAGMRELRVSLSHCDEYATAVAILHCDPEAAEPDG